MERYLEENGKRKHGKGKGWAEDEKGRQVKLDTYIVFHDLN